MFYLSFILGAIFSEFKYFHASIVCFRLTYVQLMLTKYLPAQKLAALRNRSCRFAVNSTNNEPWIRYLRISFG